MKKSLVAPPDPFGLSPLALLLPVVGQIGGLTPLTSSLFARFEKVQALKAEVSVSVDAEAARTAFRRLAAEEAMLKEVLDWLAVKPEQSGAPEAQSSSESNRGQLLGEGSN